MAASQVSFLMENGATFAQTVYWRQSDGTPVNLTGYTVDVLVQDQNTGALYTDTQVTVTHVEGKIELVIPAIDTATLTEGFYNFELKVTSSGAVVTRLLQGKIRTSPSYF